MALVISKSGLASRAVRSAIGKRIFNPNSLTQKSGAGKLINWIVNGLGRLAGFIVKSIIGLASWSLSALWGMFVQSVNYIWQFNWNITDKQLDAQVKQRWNSMAGILGGAAGNAFGWFACGILPGVSIFAFNRAMGLYVLKEVGEEALDELAAELAVVVRSLFNNLSATAFNWAFKNLRSWLKQPGNIFAQALFGDRYAEVMKNWGKEGGPSWSFAKAVEDRIEKIPNEFLKNFLEEFLEEAWDACIEAGFVVANSVESYLAMQKQQKTVILGPERVIEIIPDREATSEAIVLAGPEQLIRAQLPHAMITHQLLENRDIGQWVGEPAEDEARRGDLTLRLRVILYNSPAPPFQSTRNGKVTRVTVTIPQVRRSKLDWADIRTACGGANGYMWGRFRAEAKLTNGRSLTCYGATNGEAEDRLKAFARLSEAEIKTLNITEELKEGDRQVNEGLYKETTRVYPAYCFIMNRELVLATDRGRPVGKSRYKDTKFRLELWGTQKPFDWEDIVAEALKKSGSTSIPSP